MNTIKSAAAMAATGAALMGGPAEASPTQQNDPAPIVQQSGPEVPNAIWNGFKKVVGLPYQETEYWSAQEAKKADAVKSTAERGLWGLWTYKEDSYTKDGQREETHYYKRNNEVKRDEFHAISGARSWTGEIRNGRPVGRVRTFDMTGQEKGSYLYDDNGLQNGLQREYTDGRLTHEFTMEHGKRDGEERFYDSTTGSLQRTVPWKQDAKHGTENNLVNGDYTTYANGVKNGPFKETTKEEGPTYASNSLERTGTYRDGVVQVKRERLIGPDGTLKRDTPFNDKGQKDGTERFEHGDFTTYTNGVKNGPFQETQLDRGSEAHNANALEKTGTYRDGVAHVSKERVLQPGGKVIRETHYDENGQKHGEERIGESTNLSITPYNHGKIDGVQRDGANYTTYNQGKMEGPYWKVSTPALNGKWEPQITEAENGTIQNGTRTVQSKTFTKMIYGNDQSIAGIPITEQQAKEESLKVVGQSGLQKTLAAAANGGTGTPLAVPADKAKEVEKGFKMMSTNTTTDEKSAPQPIRPPVNQGGR